MKNFIFQKFLKIFLEFQISKKITKKSGNWKKNPENFDFFLNISIEKNFFFRDFNLSGILNLKKLIEIPGNWKKKSSKIKKKDWKIERNVSEIFSFLKKI